MQRNAKINENNFITPCPKCGNNTKFTFVSEKVAEDCCEVWMKCICGFDPTKENTGNRMEDVWGDLSEENCKVIIINCWNKLF